MSEWKEYKLGEIINVKHGYAFKGEYFSDTPTLDILLTPGNFNIGGGFKKGKLKYYNGEYPITYILNEGDIVAIDCGVKHKGYFTDMAITVPVGEIKDEYKKLLEEMKQITPHKVFDTSSETLI